MSTLWLTPVSIDETEPSVTLLCERLELAPGAAADRFLALMKSVHPRLLVSFKANLLLSEDSEACGIDELPFELAGGGQIVFGEGALELSHCAQAYWDRLPSAAELEGWLGEAVRLAENNPDPVVGQWVAAMQNWHRQGFAIALLRGE
ncbi:hypothetical protein [Paenibacillus piri]|uniref:Uncharacterized protein n=1 Tax=Paenibacillus piri TaxID=2547395 RepID=A0A4R5KM81_9BACL|nr:hypothetical protein [Paenibacillus piri]TDF96709.1 hypothetical protein E1757_16645 [Paenibacillus piri]